MSATRGETLLPTMVCMSAPHLKFKLTGGFTLIELLVAIALMALMAGLSWRGLDGMARAQQHTRQVSDEVLVLQAGLAQWVSDLNSLATQAGTPSLEWDGRSMRILRKSMDVAAAGLQVVAWSRRDVNGTGMWLRWQSQPANSRAEMESAWQTAGIWAQSPNANERAREISIVPLERWEVFYHRGGAWSNPLSSEGADANGQTPGGSTTPDGIRLVLHLPPGTAVSGVLTRDWLNIGTGNQLGGTRPPRVEKPPI